MNEIKNKKLAHDGIRNARRSVRVNGKREPQRFVLEPFRLLRDCGHHRRAYVETLKQMWICDSSSAGFSRSAMRTTSFLS
jgi:hypothetical protein